MASIQINRGTTTEIENTPYRDGLISFDTDKKEILMDSNGERETYGANGTEVTANPQGQATGDLQTLGIGEDIYNISGGHTIQNTSGTAVTQRTKMRINGAYVHDDSTNQVTDVDIVRDMLKSEIESLSGDAVEGFQHSTDEPDEVQFTIPTELDDLNDVSISNVADGQILKYDSQSGKWINVNESGGGGLTDRTFNVASTDWEQNQDSSTNTDYPYIAEITTAYYSNNSKPIWQMNGVGTIPTLVEQEEIQKIIVAVFTSTKITLYAINEPSVALVLEVKGE